MSDYKFVPMQLSQGQLSKIKHGKPVQIKPDQIGGNNGGIYLHPMNYKKLERAMKHNKGVRLMIGADEIGESSKKGGFGPLAAAVLAPVATQVLSGLASRLFG